MRKTIQIIRYFDMALLLGILALVVLVMRGPSDAKLLIIEGVIILPLLVAFFLKRVIIRYFLYRTHYPGVYWDVMEKLQMTHKMELYPQGDWLEEIYAPSYSTARFLQDNQLHPQIRSGKFFKVLRPVMGAAAIALFFLFREKKEPGNYIILFAGIGFCIYLLAQWLRELYPLSEGPVRIDFTTTALKIKDRPPLKWNAVYDWEYNGAQIVVWYYDTQQQPASLRIETSDLDTSIPGVFMLMTHYKGKYGQNIPSA